MATANQSSTHSGALRSPGPLDSPVLSFNLNAKIEALRRENAWQWESARSRARMCPAGRSKIRSPTMWRF
jgi:hypothetical protein